MEDLSGATKKIDNKKDFYNAITEWIIFCKLSEKITPQKHVNKSTQLCSNIYYMVYY